MKTFKLPFLWAVASFALVNAARAQDSNTDNHTISISIPEVALVDIEPAAAKNIVMGFTAPIEAGLPLVAPTNNSTLWLNYSSIKSTADATRIVSVRLDALIPGVDINLTAAAAAGAGGGELGVPNGSSLTLTAADQTIISGIGSAFTGDGVSNGHNLTYALALGNGTSVAAYEDLEATTTAIATVTYTISDN